MTKHVDLGSRIEGLLDRLYEHSAGQNPDLGTYFSQRAQEPDFDWNSFDKRTNEFLSDKLVALDREKAEFCYQICRALRATRVVEAGTSYGVSTLFLAAAVRDNVGGALGKGVVIGTEYAPLKVNAARANFEKAGVSDFIELLEGDLRETLKNVGGPIDFMLVDIWTPMARPALELVSPFLRDGAVVICDNTAQFRDAYNDYFEFLGDPANRFRTLAAV